ncbi:MAG: helix-turn-helix domain-containing protein [Hydrogenophaga sp.]|uniref:helix-turn-helix transcriptional regulator n=1 Tax=Hydrogenophaga sp. TaxID=1904254 RepID=UPI00169E9B4C|nr:AraC family transcriptional regulator [Hydrogenophaga sp.]NIM43152.1 helix-turn-helix domain-containing protein [Hydrogenophaga sp.]NIN28220.1 helix-turn-helix domain-containing protein [Hydrogenophaga sp.]NIN30658.1 helix-turn-helix domain-containing protein [Hydrogenophaga sp.]NIN57355.1 helix-turn-helix domain-containing protein [Hydrogenophaga sp.]NIO51574.1 helix-turn-helix domain-containing protein [Hydrogenophaga sp.]
MDDFAPAAMMRVVQQGLRRQGIAPPPAAPTHLGRVALPDKRAHLQALWQTHGPGVVARLGEAVHDLPDDPLLTAFAPARDPFDLLERWQRLERFVHSRHRVEGRATGPAALSLRHLSLRRAAPPTDAEDLLVVGLLLALTQRLGMSGLRARPCGTRAWLFDEGWRATARWPSRLHAWEWQWSGTIAPTPVDDAPTPLALLQADPARGWTLARLAQAMGLSPRTLQRRLAGQGGHFSGLLAQARLNHSAHHLAASTASLAEVGYLSGFADQPHFTRQFRAHTGLTPAQFRAQFGAAAPAGLNRSASPR